MVLHILVVVKKMFVICCSEKWIVTIVWATYEIISNQEVIESNTIGNVREYV